MHYHEIESQTELGVLLASTNNISKHAFQNVDFTVFGNLLKTKTFSDCIFLGCGLSEAFELSLRTENLIFPKIDIPFNPYVGSLYNKDTLLGEYLPGKPESYEQTFDKRVYNNFIAKGKEAGNIKETLARRLHDHAITDALYDFLHCYDERKVVAIMGGHDLPRNDINYFEIASISKMLTEKGYLMISGGGPGAMEATHLGAWFAGNNITQLLTAVEMLSEAPTYKHPLWLDTAFMVIDQFPQSNFESLGIPTWFYGHEPPTPFASKIAKYFENSIREDGLLAIAKGGVIFSPGNAGTVQEIFQDAAQNHYLSFGMASPMVFFNKHYWNSVIPVYPMLNQLAQKGTYKNMLLSSCNTAGEVVAEILKFI